MDIMIIFTNSLAYVFKLKKRSEQSENSSFYSCSTNVIQNTTFARCYLQVIRNLRPPSPLFSKVCGTKLFKTSSYTQVCLATVFGLLGRFLASNLWRLLESRRSEYFTMLAYIISNFAIILEVSNTDTWPASPRLYI